MTRRGRSRLVNDAGSLEQRVPTWDEIAREHRQFMYTVAYRLCGNHEQAEDLVQTALVRVERGLAGYQPGNLRGWLGRITTNVFLDETRRRRRRPEQTLGDEPDRFLVASLSAEDALDAAALPRYIQEAIGRLSDDHRSALVLCDVVGLSYPEIADALDIPVGTVRSRISRARTSLRDELTPHLEQDRGR